MQNRAAGIDWLNCKLDDDSWPNHHTFLNPNVTVRKKFHMVADNDTYRLSDYRSVRQSDYIEPSDLRFITKHTIQTVSLNVRKTQNVNGSENVFYAMHFELSINYSVF
jgi:hypothetical protein